MPALARSPLLAEGGWLDLGAEDRLHLTNWGLRTFRTKWKVGVSIH